MSWDIVAIGECMIELFAEDSRGELYRRSVGGDTLNCIAAASRAGARCAYLTRFATDPLRAPLEACLDQFGIDRALVRDSDGFNSLYFIETDASGERSFHYLRQGSAASRLSPADIDAAQIAQARIVYTSGITQAISDTAHAAAMAACQAARAAGRQVALDVNFRARLISPEGAAERLAAILPLVDWLFVSEGDQPILARALGAAGDAAAGDAAAGDAAAGDAAAGDAAAGDAAAGDESALASLVLERGVSVCIFKNGAGPVRIAARALAEPLVLTPPCVAVVDTSGAGDVFNGACLAHYLKSGDLAESARIAIAAAARQVTRRGTLSALIS